MLDRIDVDYTSNVSDEAIAASDVLRFELKRTDFERDLLQDLLNRISDSGSTARLVARISAAATTGAAAAQLADVADSVEIEFPAQSPARVAAALHASDAIAAHCLRRTDSVTAVFEVSRTMLGHLHGFVGLACAAGFNGLEFKPLVIAAASGISDSVFFDREAFNADLDRAIKAGKQSGVVVKATKFGSQGPVTADAVPGHTRTLVICLGQEGNASQGRHSVASFVPGLMHCELPTTHFTPEVVASEVFRSRMSARQAEHNLIDRLTPLLERYCLDPALYADVAVRLGIDVSASLKTAGSAPIRGLNRAIDRRFGDHNGIGQDRIQLDLTKPFLGYNWGPKNSFLLPDQYQFWRTFNDSQTPVILVKVALGHSYRASTVIHNAEPGDTINFLQLRCNDFVPAEQGIQWHGRQCLHVCTVPASVIDAAGGNLRIAFTITRQRMDAGISTIGLRSFAMECLDSAPRRSRMAVFRGIAIRAMAPRVRDNDLADGFGIPSPSDPIEPASFPEDLDAATAAVLKIGFARLGKEAIIAKVGFELAELCRQGMLDEAARRIFVDGRKVDTNAVAWLKSPLVEHRYTNTESSLQFLTLVKAVFVERNQVEHAGAVFLKLTETAPTWRPGWLALAEYQIEAGRYDAAINSARSAVHNDVCCIVSQEVLRSAYLAKYPYATEPVIDGVPVYDLTDRFCNIPFDRIETAKDGVVWTCCPAWLGAPVGNMHRSPWEDAWNSDQAAMVRESILDGNFRYCNKGVCPAILADALPRKSEVTDPYFRHYIDNKIVKLPEGPREISISHDPSCNLACPQCRNEFILADRSQNAEFAATIEPFIKPLIDYANLDKSIVLMSGDGEIFISPHYYAILKLFDEQKHAGITLNLLSNGLVFESGWNKVPNIHPLVHKVTISTDAASEQTYRSIRGGSWAKLYRNLEFIAGLRRQGVIKRFEINYAVQAANYKDMKRMIEIGLNLGVERIAFAILRNGGTYEAAEYGRRAIFEQGHPDNADFIRELQHPIFRNPIVDISQFAGFLSVNDPAEA